MFRVLNNGPIFVPICTVRKVFSETIHNLFCKKESPFSCWIRQQRLTWCIRECSRSRLVRTQYEKSNPRETANTAFLPPCSSVRKKIVKGIDCKMCTEFKFNKCKLPIQILCNCRKLIVRNNFHKFIRKVNDISILLIITSNLRLGEIQKSTIFKIE